MSNPNPIPSAASTNFLIDDAVARGTLDNVAGVLQLLAGLDPENLGERSAFALHLLLAKCAVESPP